MQQTVASGLAAQTCQFDRPCTNLAWCSFPGEPLSQRIHLISPPTIIYKTAAKEIDRPRSQDNTPGRQFGPQVKQSTRRTLPNKTLEVSTMAGTLPNKDSEVSKPLRTWLGHFRITVRKCSVDTSEVLFGGVHRTLPNRYSEVSYMTISPFNPVSCRFH